MMNMELNSTASKIIAFDEPVTKECTKCKETKTLDDFYTLRDGYRSQCKKCSIASAAKRAKETKVWLKKSPERRLKDAEYQREYRKKNVEKRRKWQKEWLERNPNYHHERYIQRKKGD